MKECLQTTTYNSYLLRCWQDPQVNVGERWRFAVRTVSAEPTETYFENVAQLMAFISAEFTSSTSPITQSD